MHAGTLSFGVFGAQAYLAANGSHSKSGHSWLGVNELLSRSPVGVWQEALPQDRIVAKADSFVALAQMAASGMGLVMIPSILGVQSDVLMPAPQFPDRLEIDLWVASHQDLETSPRIGACIEHFAQRLRALPELSAGGH